MIALIINLKSKQYSFKYSFGPCFAMVALSSACRTSCRSLGIGVSAFSSVSKLARQKNRRDTSAAFLTLTRLYQRDEKVMELSDDTEKKSNGLNLKLFGGDFAGHSASFDSLSGSLIPVPEYLLPESMIEWGQVPSSWEVLTSEDWKDDCDLALERNVAKVVPEVAVVALIIWIPCLLRKSSLFRPLPCQIVRCYF